MPEAEKLPRTERQSVNEVERSADAMDDRKAAGKMYRTDYDDWTQEEKERVFDEVTADIRHEDFLYGCYECGICVSACPSARFYDFSPRRIAQAVGREDVDLFFEQLNDDIWDCSQCFSCNRCPRQNSPGGLVTMMREVAVTENLESAEAALEGYERVIYKIMSTGTQVSPDMLQPDAFPDWGPSTRDKSEHMEEWRMAIPPETLHTTETAWTVSDRTINELFLIWKETDVVDMLEDIDPGIHMILTDMMEDKIEEGGFGD